MNAEHLRELLETYLAAEDQVDLPTALAGVRQAFLNFQQNPTQVFFTNRNNALGDLEQTSEQFAEIMNTPIGSESLKTLKLEAWSVNAANEATQIARNNSDNPSIALQRLDDFISKRREFVDHIRYMVQFMDRIGVISESKEYSDLYINFKIPRTYFYNSPKIFSAVISDIDVILSVFTQLAEDDTPETQIGTISTTDPVVAFSVSVKALSLLVDTLKLAVEFAKGVNSLRNVFSGGGSANRVSVPPIEKTIDDMVQKFVESESQKLIDSSAIEKQEDRNAIRPSVEFAVEKLCKQLQGGVTVSISSTVKAVGSFDSEQLAEINSLMQAVASIDFPTKAISHQFQIASPAPSSPEASEDD